MKKTLIYKFTRRSIEANDPGRFLAVWVASGAADPCLLRGAMDSFEFFVSGYDDDPRELVLIPEVRAFFRTFNARWPFWSFACDLSMHSLMMMTMCCLDNLLVTQFEPWRICRANFWPPELASFVEKELLKLDAACHRAGLSPDETRARRDRVLKYYGCHPGTGAGQPPAI